MNADVFSFVIHMIRESADCREILTGRVFQKMKEIGFIGYDLIPDFDVLQTSGAQYPVYDISEYVEKRGVTI